MNALVKGLSVVLAMVVSSAVYAAEYKQGEVIVKYKDGVVRTRTMMHSLYDKSGALSIHRYKGMMTGFEDIKLAENVKVEDAIAELMKNPSVEYAHPNYIFNTLPVLSKAPAKAHAGLPGLPGIPCIPGFDIPGCDPSMKLPCLFPGFPPGCGEGGGGGGDEPQPPSATRPDLNPAPADVNPPVVDPQLADEYGVTKIGATDAWKVFAGNKDFVVADIDTGIDYNHEDLAFNVWRNPNPTKNDVAGFDFVHGDGLPYDDNMHGTHTAGTIGAVGNNGIGLSGVSQRVSIMSLKFLTGEGQGNLDDAIKAIDYAVEHGAKVISASWGAKGAIGADALKEAIERAGQKGVLFVVAAGNDSGNNDNPSDGDYPAAWATENMIAVAATDTSDDMAFFSNYGAKTVHLGAPGVSILSTVPGNKYKKADGTSMACPHVAGAAALLWSKKPSMTRQEVKELLLKSVDPVPALQGKTVTGGRLNVYKALQAME